MSRISYKEFDEIKKMVQNCRAAEFKEFKKKYNLPNPEDTSFEAAEFALNFLKTAFSKFSLLDAIVAMKGMGPSTPNDTHYRGRVLEEVLDGSFDGKSKPDFGYAELKLIETWSKHELVQVMTAGCIFKREHGEYEIIEKFEDSNFYKKMQRVIVISYKKVGKQLGFDVNGAFIFELKNQLWFEKIKADWDCIKVAMSQAINDEKSGKIKRKRSGILSSKLKTPNNYLKVRSDSVVITNDLFKIISNQ